MEKTRLTQTQFENISKWIAALESDEFFQGNVPSKLKRRIAPWDEDTHENYKWAYCCLGVGCEVVPSATVEGELIGWSLPSNTRWKTAFGFDYFQRFTIDGESAPLAAHNDGGYVYEFMNEHSKKGRSKKIRKKTFKEIAQALRKFASDAYIDGV